MKALAGFIVSGRAQAILVATLSGVLAFLLTPFSTLTNYLGAAAVALVTLHIGAMQGLLVLVVSSVLTMLFYQLAGMPAVAIAITILLLWLPCWAISYVLRSTVSLSTTMLAAAGLGVTALLLVYAAYGDPATWWFERLQLIRPALEQAGLFPEGVQVDELLLELSRLLTGVVLASLMLGALCSLLLARWWQALLVNPGGMRKEFCSLRFPSLAGLVTLGLMVLSRFVEGPASQLAAQIVMLLLVPYLFAGLAVLHGLVAQKGKGRGWLIAVYVILAIQPQAMLLLAGGGLMDTWIDFRRRLGGGGDTPKTET